MRQLLVLLPILAIAGCSSNVSGGFTVNLTGNWVGEMISTTGANPPFSGKLNMNITQNQDGTLEGLAAIRDPETLCWAGGTITDNGPVAVPLAGVGSGPGSVMISAVTGNKVTFIIEDEGGATITVDGSATSNTLSAIYTSNGGNCEAHSGTFNIVRS